MSVTFAVFQLLRLRLLRAEHSRNRSDISVTLPVLKPLTSRLVRDVHLSNKPYMLVTLAVLKPLKSIVVSLLQPKNIYFISMTRLVLRYCIPVIVTRFVMLLNHMYVVVGRAEANDGANTTLVTFVMLLCQPGVLPLGFIV